MNEWLLQLENVKTHFPIAGGLLFNRQPGVVRAVDGVSLKIRKGEVLGLVGESGCGKTTLARTILRLVPLTAGKILFEGQNLAALSENQMRR